MEEGELGACHFLEFSVWKADTECLIVSPAATIGFEICLFLLIQIIYEEINIEKMNTL